MRYLTGLKSTFDVQTRSTANAERTSYVEAFWDESQMVCPIRLLLVVGLRLGNVYGTYKLKKLYKTLETRIVYYIYPKKIFEYWTKLRFFTAKKLTVLKSKRLTLV